MIMISYDDRVKYYTELTSLEAFYKESELWRILVTTMKKHNMYNEKFYGHSVLELLNEARFACLRIYSDDSPLLYFPEKYIIPTDKKLGEEAKILCCSMVLVLLYFSSPDFACRDSFIRTLHDYLQNDRNFKYFVRIIKDHQPFSFDINFGELLHAMVEATSVMNDDSNATTETNEEVSVDSIVENAIKDLVRNIMLEKDAEIAMLKEEYEKKLSDKAIQLEQLEAEIEEKDSRIQKEQRKQEFLDKKIQELEIICNEEKQKTEEIHKQYSIVSYELSQKKESEGLSMSKKVNAKEHYDRGYQEGHLLGHKEGVIQGAEDEKKRIDSTYLPLANFIDEACACDVPSDIEKVEKLLADLTSSTIFRGPHIVALSETANLVKEIKKEKKRKIKQEERTASQGVSTGSANNGIMAGNDVNVNLPSDIAGKLIESFRQKGIENK